MCTCRQPGQVKQSTRWPSSRSRSAALQSTLPRGTSMKQLLHRRPRRQRLQPAVQMCWTVRSTSCCRPSRLPSSSSEGIRLIHTTCTCTCSQACSIPCTACTQASGKWLSFSCKPGGPVKHRPLCSVMVDRIWSLSCGCCKRLGGGLHQLPQMLKCRSVPSRQS